MSRATRDADVIVVGGGPAGSATATLLARHGHDVLLLERTAFPREKPCGEYLSPGVVDVLSRLDVLGRITRACPAWPSGMRIRTPRTGFTLAYADAGHRRTALGIPRAILDQILLEQARAEGVRVQERVRVYGTTTEDGRVTGVRVRDSSVSNGSTAFQARFVVAADGIHSTVARSLGLEQPVRWPRRLGLVARYAGVRGIHRYGEMHVRHPLYCGLAPVGPNLVNIGLVGPLGRKRPGEATADFFERQLAELPGVAAALQDARRVTPIRGVGPLARRVQRVSGPGYLLVGDAAGFFDPFTGEGVYRALRGAEIAADVLSRAIQQGTSSPRGYERERHRAFWHKERVCELVQLFLSSSRLFDYVIDHLSERPQVASVVSGVLGDYRPAGLALRPGLLWGVLRP